MTSGSKNLFLSFLLYSFHVVVVFIIVVVVARGVLCARRRLGGRWGGTGGTHAREACATWEAARAAHEVGAGVT